MANRILIIDHEPANCAVIDREARACGYEVEIATTLGEFLRHLGAWSPTHLVLDLQMPGADGVEMLRLLADAESKAKIIIASGADQRIIEVVQRLGTARGLTIAATITKPLHLDHLRAVLDRLHDDAEWLSEAALSEAIAADELFLEYQPKLDLRVRRITGVEALLRWRHPARGVLSPFLFVPFAETTGLMDRVTRWVLATSVRQLGEWSAAGVQIGMAVNLSARNLANPAIAEELAAICREAGVSPDLITLELTESAAMSSLIGALEVLTRLRIAGMHLSLDDFGTGYSSLVQLHRLPFSEVKIDRIFVSDCHSSRDSRVMVKAMIDLVHNLGLVSVAEGVETEEGLGVLEELHCDMAQGFLIARPMAGAKFAAWLQNHPGPPEIGDRQPQAVIDGARMAAALPQSP